MMQPAQPLPACTTVEVCADPKIVVASQFLTHEECEHFKLLGRQHGMQRAKLVGKDTGVDVTTNERTNASCWLPHDVSPTAKAVVDRISNFVGIPSANAEQIQLIYYQPGQFYLAHYDGWAVPGPNEPEPIIGSEAHILKERYMNGQGGQRMLTTLVYLNTLPAGAGGETAFPNLHMLEPAQTHAHASQPAAPPRTLKVHPEMGKMVCFSNVYAGTNKLHPNSLHMGSPVGEVIDSVTGQMVRHVLACVCLSVCLFVMCLLFVCFLISHTHTC